MQQKVYHGQSTHDTILRNKGDVIERSNKYRKGRKQEPNLPQFKPNALLNLLGRTLDAEKTAESPISVQQIEPRNLQQEVHNKPDTYELEESKVVPVPTEQVKPGLDDVLLKFEQEETQEESYQPLTEQREDIPDLKTLALKPSITAAFNQNQPWIVEQQQPQLSKQLTGIMAPVNSYAGKINIAYSSNELESIAKMHSIKQVLVPQTITELNAQPPSISFINQ